MVFFFKKILEEDSFNESFKTPSTLPETNMAPENRQFQKETSIPTIHLRGYVGFREDRIWSFLSDS